VQPATPQEMEVELQKWFSSAREWDSGSRRHGRLRGSADLGPATTSSSAHLLEYSAYTPRYLQNHQSWGLQFSLV